MFQEFPKWIDIPGHEHGGKVVFDREEEARVKPDKVEDQTEADEPKKRGRPRKAQ